VFDAINPTSLSRRKKRKGKGIVHWKKKKSPASSPPSIFAKKEKKRAWENHRIRKGKKKKPPETSHPAAKGGGGKKKGKFISFSTRARKEKREERRPAPRVRGAFERFKPGSPNEEGKRERTCQRKGPQSPTLLHWG